MVRHCMLLAVLVAQAAAADGTHGLPAALVGMPERILHYEETRKSPLLARPVTYRGRLEYDPDTGRLTKWVDEPRRARLTMTSTHLEARAGTGKVRRLPLERRPELAALLIGVRSLLSGDAATLERTFVTSHRTDGDGAWVMYLEPRDGARHGRLRLLEIRGDGDRVNTIDTVLADDSRRQIRILADTTPNDAP